jgi:hypothetical protein
MKQPIPETPPDYDESRVIERPDGFYWIDKETEEAYGPFPTLLEAVEDMEYNAEADKVTSDDLAVAEDELGISDWVDPDTGEPAEDTFTRLEDH